MKKRFMLNDYDCLSYDYCIMFIYYFIVSISKGINETMV